MPWDLSRCHYEICSYCESFEAVKKLGGGKYICQTCNESSTDLLSYDRQKKSEQNDNTNARTTTIKKPTECNTTGVPRTKEIELPKQRKNYRIDSSKNAILNYLRNNSDKAFNTKQLIEIFADDFNSKVIKNALGIMVRDGNIYSRAIGLKGKKLYSIYSVTESKIAEYTSDETSAKILEKIKRETYCTIKTLVETLNLSHQYICKTIRDRLSEDVKTFENRGRHYYIDAKDEEKIKFFRKKHCSARLVK